MKKMVLLVLSVLMFAALFTGCQQNIPAPSLAPSSQGTASPVPSAEAAGVTYPIEGNVTLSLAIADEPAVSITCALAETPFVKAWEEATGVTLKITHPSDFSLLFASGELPDIISYNLSSYIGGAAQAVADKIVYPITDLLKECAPDLNEVLNSNDVWRKSVSTSDGEVIGFPFIRGTPDLLTSFGLIIRQDWLDELKMDIPQTPDELYEVLVAFRDKMGATAPISMRVKDLRNYCTGNGLITSAFGFAQGDFYQIDGKVYYGYYQQQYKDLLEYLNKLYNDGLLDSNFTTIDSNTLTANIMGGISGLTVGSGGGGLATWISTMADKVPQYNLSAVGSLVANRGNTAMSNKCENAVTGAYLAITTACKNKEAAAKFLNYGYTEEGHMFMNYGIKGETYIIEDGIPTFTDLIINNPNGLTKQQAQAQYTRSWNYGAFVQEKTNQNPKQQIKQQEEAIIRWSNTDAISHVLPSITIAQDSVSEYTKLSGDVSTYVDEMFVKFVTNIEPLSNFDTYLSTLKGMGVETMIQIQQEALDEFNAR